jgi:hypothetical protein
MKLINLNKFNQNKFCYFFIEMKLKILILLIEIILISCQKPFDQCGGNLNEIR